MLFFSYRSSQVELIRLLADWLKGHSISLWMDEFSINHKEQAIFQEKINEGIDKAERVVVFLSNDYLDSGYCLAELERALRKLPLKNIHFIVLKRNEEFRVEKFFLLFPSLEEKKSGLFHEVEEINQVIVLLGRWLNIAIKSIPLLSEKSSDEKNYWINTEVGLKFSYQGFIRDFGSIFLRSKGKEINSLLGRQRENHERFKHGDNSKFKFELDYGIYESHHSEVQTDLLKPRQFNTERDWIDRIRLREEMEAFDNEVSSSLQMFFDSNPKIAEKHSLNIAEVEEIGVHLLHKTDVNNKLYKHRMFTFGMPLANLTFRMVKLVFPHPIRKTPSMLRVLFSFQGSRKDFFLKTFHIDSIIGSLEWIANGSHKGIAEFSKKLR